MKRRSLPGGAPALSVVVAACGLVLRVGEFDPRATDEIAPLGLGLLPMGPFAARTFGRCHGGNAPVGS